MKPRDRIDKVILSLPAVRAAIFFLFMAASWAVGYQYAHGFRARSLVALAFMVLSFLLLKQVIMAGGGRPRRRAWDLSKLDSPPPGHHAWPQALFLIERDKALHFVRQVQSKRPASSQPPQTIWREEMRAFGEYVTERCQALRIKKPEDLLEKVAWCDRQSLLVKDYAAAMALHLVRLIEASVPKPRGNRG